MNFYNDISSVEKELGIRASTLYKISNSIPKHYHPVNIPKKSGGMRTLHVPDEALKRIQKAINEKLLNNMPISKYATAYKQSSSIVDNARPHISKAKVLKLDILGFFDNIKYIDVKEIAFPEQYYSENIRILLSLLCYYMEVLPQGAPTSPAISNIILYEFDNQIGEYCRKKKISYTRYCDDMTFSGDDFDEKTLIAYVERKLKKNGFLLNKKKTKSFSSSNRQEVTGIVVNEKANISNEYKRKIRQEVFFLKKYGVNSHLEALKSEQEAEKYLTSLLGKINFVLQICPDDKNFKEYKKIITKQLKETIKDNT